MHGNEVFREREAKMQKSEDGKSYFSCWLIKIM